MEKHLLSRNMRPVSNARASYLLVLTAIIDGVKFSTAHLNSQLIFGNLVIIIDSPFRHMIRAL